MVADHLSIVDCDSVIPELIRRWRGPAWIDTLTMIRIRFEKESGALRCAHAHDLVDPTSSRLAGEHESARRPHNGAACKRVVPAGSQRPTRPNANQDMRGQRPIWVAPQEA